MQQQTTTFNRIPVRGSRLRPKCFICSEPVSAITLQSGGRFTFRGKREVICQRCRNRYWRAITQASMFGKRFAFIERSAVPQIESWRGSTFTEIYHILTLLRERQTNLKKEVKWMPEDKAKSLIKLPDRIAAVVSKTFAVRGDDATMSDDQALIRIRDLLEQIDADIIERNKNKRLP